MARARELRGRGKTERIRICVLSDDPVVVRRVIAAFAGFDEFELVSLRTDANEGLDHVVALKPHVAIIDVSDSAAGCGFASIQRLRKSVPVVRILALVEQRERGPLAAGAAAGAQAVLAKPVEGGSLRATVRALVANLRVMSPDIRGDHADTEHQTEPAQIPLLSLREIEVMTELDNGLSRKEIADKLGIKERTVDYHTQLVYEKLGSHRRADALNRFRAWKLSLGGVARSA